MGGHRVGRAGSHRHGRQRFHAGVTVVGITDTLLIVDNVPVINPPPGADIGEWEMIPPWLKHRRIAMHRM